MNTKPTHPTSAHFGHVENWVFDLDNTLYPRHTNLFAQIDVKMTEFVSNVLSLPQEQARVVQKQYYKDHGTTLQGMMINHGIDPHAFLEAVHDIDYSWLKPDPRLGDAIRDLPGNKYIFTNGDTKHAERTASALGILDHFDEIFDIVAADLLPKPADETYHRFLAKHNVNPETAAMFEDMPRNLEAPRKLGMTTVLILPGNMEDTFAEVWEHADSDGEHIDFVTDDLNYFLTNIHNLYQ